MPHIVVIGGGFAGVWSAASAAQVRHSTGAELRITLIAPNSDLVLRPRLYEADPGRATVALDRIVKPIDVEHVRASVRRIDVARRRVTTDDGRDIDYDRLVLASGSRLIRPELPGADRLFDIDTLDGAQRLQAHLGERPGFHAMVVGAGFTGLELATELASRGRVLLVDRATDVGPELGAGPRPQILMALDELGIACRLGVTVTEVGDGFAALSDGSRIDTDAVVWTAGLQASPLTLQIPGPRDHLGRLEVDEWLRVTDDVFAAGDTAAARIDPDHSTVQSCQYAVPLGKTAGHNAAADLLGLAALPFAPDPYVTCLDLGAAGAVLAEGWDRRVQASGSEGKKIKEYIMQLIHPPVDDADAILSAAREIRGREV
ncbi:NAD(P)/FAD-dependent oxidoreductase [Nocardia sp. NBC_01329]|uniref:NAD(P)/FAD-dependent oxidoreductase n=1 Tax=Nocardia sp. NBC_01329 TaxID=2903594 RepID=UPI002E14ED7D|nr:FAD-dependent oxidoreductase [Nocardia sp. NBC_01329]